MSGVEVISRGDRAQALHGQAAEIVGELARFDDREERMFRRVEEMRELMLEIGARWEPVLSQRREAAYGVWRQHGAREHRLELASVAEAPLPPEEER